MTDSKILDIPSEVISINDATQQAINTAGRLMCERMERNADFCLQAYLNTGDRKALLSWVGFSNRADSALLTYNKWKRGEM